MELVPPKREKLLSSPKVAKNPPEKVKVQVRVCQTFTFTVTWQELFLCVAGCDFDFHFLVGILQSSVNLVIFSLLGGTSSILRTFLGGTSEKTHPVSRFWRIFDIYVEDASNSKYIKDGSNSIYIKDASKSKYFERSSISRYLRFTTWDAAKRNTKTGYVANVNWSLQHSNWKQPTGKLNI